MRIAARDNIAHMLLDTADFAGGQPAIVHAGLATTYSDLAARSAAIGRALADAAGGPGDRVGILLDGGRDGVAAVFGVLAWGAGAGAAYKKARPPNNDS